MNLGATVAVASADVTTKTGEKLHILGSGDIIGSGFDELPSEVIPASVSFRSGLDAQTEVALIVGWRQASLFGRRLLVPLEHAIPIAVRLNASHGYSESTSEVGLVLEAFPNAFGTFRWILGFGGNVGRRHHFLAIPHSVEEDHRDNYVGPALGLNIFRTETRIDFEVGLGWRLLTVVLEPYLAVSSGAPEIKIDSSLVSAVESYSQQFGVSLSIIPNVTLPWR